MTLSKLPSWAKSRPWLIDVRIEKLEMGNSFCIFLFFVAACFGVVGTPFTLSVCRVVFFIAAVGVLSLTRYISHLHSIRYCEGGA